MRFFKYFFLVSFLTISSAGAINFSEEKSFNSLIKELLPAVVSIQVTTETKVNNSIPKNIPPAFKDLFEEFFKDRAPRQGKSQGSGFIIDEDKGYIVTNEHVVKNGKNFKIILNDGREYTANLLGTDKLTDLAVLKLNNYDGLATVSFGDSDDAKVGDWVIAIGNPLGLGGTVTSGIVSARGRDIRSGPYDDFIQTDASINPGNSGGPLFNMEGEVIGINSMIISKSGSSAGLGFAIPSTLAKSIVKDLIESGKVTRGWLGATFEVMDRNMLESLGIDQTSAAFVSSVIDGDPAEKAGLKTGDIILKFNGVEITRRKRLPYIVATSPVKKKLPIEIWRENKRKTITVTLNERKDNIDDKKREPSIQGTDGVVESKSLGIKVSNITEELARRFSIRSKGGVVVVKIENNSIAYGSIPLGSVIEKVNNKIISNTKDFDSLVKKAKKEKRRNVLVSVRYRNSSKLFTLPLKN